MKKLVVLVLALLMVCATALSSQGLGDDQYITLKLKLEPSVIWSIPADLDLSLTSENKIPITVEKMFCCSKVEIIGQDPAPLTDGKGNDIFVFLKDAPAFTEPGTGYCTVTRFCRPEYMGVGEPTDDFHDAVPGEYSTTVTFAAWIR